MCHCRLYRPKKVVPVIIEGLRKLEYRGYDSAEFAVVNAAGKMDIRRAPGKLRNLEEAIHNAPLDGSDGIGHTRWATHGRPTEEAGVVITSIRHVDYLRVCTVQWQDLY